MRFMGGPSDGSTGPGALLGSQPLTPRHTCLFARLPPSLQPAASPSMPQAARRTIVAAATDRELW